MGFIPHGNNFIHKGDVPAEEREEDAPMSDAIDVTGPSRAQEGSSSSMEENITISLGGWRKCITSKP